MNQQQMQQQQIQGGQLENQQRQMDLSSQQALQKAYMEANGDPDKTTQLAAKYGAKPQALLQWQSSVLDQKAKTLDLVSKQGDIAKRDADLVQGAHDTVTNAAPQDRPAVYQQQLAALGSQLSNPATLKNLPPQYPGDEAFKMIGATVKTHSQMVDEALKSSEEAKNTQQATEAQANTQKIQAETQGVSGPLAEAKYRTILSAMQGGKPVSDADMEFARGYELANRKTTTSSDSLGVVSTNTSGPSGLSAVQKPKPSQGGGGNTKDSIVDLIGQYRADPALLSRMMYKHPEILGAVNSKYPDFDQTTYAAKNKLIQGFTSGPQSKEINAINTVSGHLDELDKAATALNNGDIQGLNSLANKLGAFVGQNPQTTFRTIVHRVGPEITTAYVSGGGGEGERFANAEDFSEKLAPSQIHNNVAETVKLLRSKIGALENQYKQTVGRDDFQQRFITPAAQSSFNKFAPPTQSAGATRTYHGHTYAQQSDGSWKLTQ